MVKVFKSSEYDRKKALEYYYANKEKCAEKHRIWADNHKDYIREKQKETKRERKLKAIDYLGGKCNDCVQTFHPAIYEFHHLNPKEKDRDPSKLLLLKWENITKELDKCVLLCANCHRLRHHVWRNND